MKRPSPTPLAGRTAVITGAASGIGRSLARRLGRYGCPLVLIDVDDAGLEETAAELEVPVITRTLDVREGDRVQALAAEVGDWAPAPLGAVFNNAGVALSASIQDGSDLEAERVMAINFGGVVNGVRAFLPMLLNQDEGAIVNTSSVFGLLGVANQSAYCASKFAVRGYTESLQLELRRTGVRAVVLHPGGVKTNIIHNAHLAASVDDGRSREELTAEFHARARTTADRAAEIIHEGIDEGRQRILIGRDARFVDTLARLAPAHTVSLFERFESLGRIKRRGG
jgi:NAD(P)-dependent dehydrogenase (short-subunit alcohol dehydrogenase family)